jgi:hypothetical protein
MRSLASDLCPNKQDQQDFKSISPCGVWVWQLKKPQLLTSPDFEGVTTKHTQTSLCGTCYLLMMETCKSNLNTSVFSRFVRVLELEEA